MKKQNEKLKNKINLNITYSSITGCTKNSTVTTYTLDTGVVYYDIPTFIKKFIVSDSTIRRRILMLEHHKEKYRYILPLDKIYISCGIVGFKKREMHNFKNEDYSQFARLYTWDLCGTVRYSDEFFTTEETARGKMEILFKKIKRRFKTNELIFFYVTEQNPGKDGYHNHFAFGCKSAIPITEITTFIKNNLKAKVEAWSPNTELEDYKIKGNWLEYMVKQIHKVPEGYNWLDHNVLA